MHVAIEYIEVLRDVHYRADGVSEPGGGKRTLGSDEYYVLGDNPLVSLDSRNWNSRGAGVRRQMLVGRALAIDGR